MPTPTRLNEVAAEIAPGVAHAVAAEPIPVVWEGGFFQTHSLALVNRELALAAMRSGEVELTIRPRESVEADTSSDDQLRELVALLDKPLLGTPVVYVRHAWPPVWERPPGEKWVMIQPWEYGRLPVDWVAPLRDQVDEIWAYSNAVKRCYTESGVPAGKIHVVPLGINPQRFHPEVEPLSLPTEKRTRFLFVGGTIWRKGIDILLAAYCRAFTRADDVCLVIKEMGQDSFYRGQTASEQIAKIQADPRAPEILYATGTLADTDMPSLYTACDCLVHPYRGEGFGLPVAEAMACGLPVIVTQGGSTDDFCSPDRAYLISASRREITIEMPTVGAPWVLEADVTALADHMRAVYEAPEEAAVLGRRAGAWVREHLTWDASARVMVARLRALARVL